MKRQDGTFMTTVYNGRFTIVYGQVKLGHKYVNFAGASLQNEDDTYNKEIGKTIATARAFKDLKKQLNKIANHKLKKAHEMIKNEMKERTARKCDDTINVDWLFENNYKAYNSVNYSSSSTCCCENVRTEDVECEKKM